MLDNLSNGRVELYDEVMTWPIRKKFTLLAYKKNKAKAEYFSRING